MHMLSLIRRSFARPRRRGLFARFNLLAASAVLAACGSVPPTRTHTLMPADAPARAQAAAAPASQPLAVVLEPIRVPAQVDQPQWLVRLADGSVALLEQERWASPLRDEMRQALLEVLVDRFGAVDTRAIPAGAVPFRVSLDVRRFDSVPGIEARIEGTWAIAGERGTPLARCDWLLRDGAEVGMPALAAAHRRALGRLGDSIGAALLQIRRGEPATCPARENASR